MADFDVYYFRHKQWVYGGVLGCNLVAITLLITTKNGGGFMRAPLGFVNFTSYFILLIGLLAARSRRSNIVLLLLMLSRYAVIPVLAILGVGMHSRLF